ncbi:MAG: hypothetical protein QM754_08020 [Tepidisphaeraceae bacterium]
MSKTEHHKGWAALKVAVQQVFPRTGRIVSDLSDEIGHQIERGATEFAAALMNGSAFVLYGKDRSPTEATNEQAHEQERDGMER